MRRHWIAVPVVALLAAGCGSEGRPSGPSAVMQQPAGTGVGAGTVLSFTDAETGRAVSDATVLVAGRPYGLWVHGNNDTVGAANAVDKVATGLALNKAADVLEVVGAIDAGVRERAYELGGTLAATLME